MAPLLLLYGTEKGNAKSICEELGETAASRGYTTVVDQLNNYEKVKFLEAPVVLIVCSTTGEGEPPESARKFWRWLKKKTHPADMLKGLKYCILGLGDTNYTKFCNGAKVIDTRLQELGAVHFYASGFADDGVGLEEVIEPWKQGLWPALASAYGGNPIDKAAGEESGSVSESAPEVDPGM